MPHDKVQLNSRIHWPSFVRQLSRSIITQNVNVCMQNLRQWRSHHTVLMGSYLYQLLKKHIYLPQVIESEETHAAPLHNGTAYTLLHLPLLILCSTPVYSTFNISIYVYIHTKLGDRAEHNVETITKSTFLERSYFSYWLSHL